MGLQLDHIWAFIWFVGLTCGLKVAHLSSVLDWWMPPVRLVFFVFFLNKDPVGTMCLQMQEGYDNTTLVIHMRLTSQTAY